MFIVENCFGEPPSRMGCGLANFGHSLARVNFWGAAHTRGQNMVFRKSWFGWVRVHLSNFVVSGSKPFFANAGGIIVDNVFRIFDILIRCRDIRHRRLLLSEIVPNVARFWPQFFFGEGSPNFRNWIIKLNQLSIMWQSFTAIGRGSSIGDLALKNNVSSET